MARTGWNPSHYLTYADERGRPFVELLARVPAAAPRTVVDLGCGPGNLTVDLAARWPGAEVVGLDSSDEMIDAARRASDAVRWEVGDVRDWAATAAPGSVDVLVSNATLQWIPGHLDLLERLWEAVAPGGWFAFAVPGNFTEPSHALRAELAATAPYGEHLAGVATPHAHDALTYTRALQAVGAEVDAWETTYLHVLHGPDPVFTWVSATGARPTLAALPADLRERFAEEFRARLARAYPDEGHGVLMPFRRVFVVAHKPGGAEA